MKILYVEDEIAHFELTQRTLEANLPPHFVLLHIDSLRGALQILETDHEIDLVLTDLSLPDGSGLDLLKKTKELQPSPAVVLVTGQGDEQAAVTALKAGASDYLVKEGDYLHRLPSVITNAIAQNQLTREQMALRAAEQRYQVLVEQLPAAVYTSNSDELASTLYISPQIEGIAGFSASEWEKDPLFWLSRVHPEDLPRVMQGLNATRKSPADFDMEYRFIHKDGRIVWVRDYAKLIFSEDGKPKYWQGILFNRTKEVDVQKALERQVKELTALHANSVAETDGASADDMIEKVVQNISQIFSEVCGVLLLNNQGDRLTPHPSYRGANISNWSEGTPITSGVTGRSVELGKTLRIGDITKETGYIEISKGIKSELCVPIQVNKRIIGVINVESRTLSNFDEEDEKFLNTVATGLGTALERLRLVQEESRRRHIIEALANVANEIATTRAIIPILDRITQLSLDLLGANHVAIYLMQEDENSIRVISAQGNHRQELLSHALKIGEGITGHIIASGKPEIIDDMMNDQRRRLVPGTPESEAHQDTMMSSPLILRGKTIGAINAWRLKANGRFNQTELDFLTGIAHQVCIAIESSNLFQESTRRAQEASAIAEVGRDISSTLQLDTVLNRIANYAKELLGVESSALYLYDPINQILNAVSAVGLDAEEIMMDPIEVGVGIVGSIASTKFGEIVNDTQNDPRTQVVKGTATLADEHIMGMPILTKDQLTGLLVVWRTGADNKFKLSDLNFLSGLAHQAAVAIENARLYDETQHRLSELETINRFSSSLRKAQSVGEMLPILLGEALALVETQHGSIWLYDHINNMLVQQVAQGAEVNFRHKTLRSNEGIVGHVFTTGERYISSDLKNDPLLFEGNRDSVVAGLGCIFIPIRSTVRTLGVMMVSIETGRIIKGEIGLLTTLSEITGNAIHRAELFDQSQEQIRKLTTLRDIDSAIASSTDLRVTLNILMDHSLRSLKADAVDIMLYHPELQSLTFLTSAGFYNPTPSRPLMRIGEGLSGQVVMKGSIEHIPDLRETAELKRDPMLARENIVSYFGVPLIVKGQIKGVFEIFHRALFTPTSDWTQFLHTLSGQAAIAIDNSQLFDNLQRSNLEIRQAYDTTLEGWARALELRDRETEGHTRRVTDMTMQLARFMKVHEDDLVNIYRGVLLHDIGKMGVPDQILRKTGPLNESEWFEMRKHPDYAFNLLSPITYLRPALDIPYCHHEHWDGSGYPRGLKGEQIPLAARIFSIVDIWDALLSDRPYRKAWPRERVVDYVKEISGKILDPNVVMEFLKMIEDEK